MSDIARAGLILCAMNTSETPAGQTLCSFTHDFFLSSKNNLGIRKNISKHCTNKSASTDLVSGCKVNTSRSGHHSGLMGLSRPEDLETKSKLLTLPENRGKHVNTNSSWSTRLFGFKHAVKLQRAEKYHIRVRLGLR